MENNYIYPYSFKLYPEQYINYFNGLSRIDNAPLSLPYNTKNDIEVLVYKFKMLTFN